jgi:hypothetical protein
MYQPLRSSVPDVSEHLAELNLMPQKYSHHVIWQRRP